MPSLGFDIRIKDGYHRSEVSLLERTIRSGETLRFYVSQEKADRLPDFLEVTPVDLEAEQIAIETAEAEAVLTDEQAEVAAAQAAADAEAADAARVEAEEKAALEAEKEAKKDEE